VGLDQTAADAKKKTYSGSHKKDLRLGVISERNVGGKSSGAVAARSNLPAREDDGRPGASQKKDTSVSSLPIPTEHSEMRFRRLPPPGGGSVNKKRRLAAGGAAKPKGGYQHDKFSKRGHSAKGSPTIFLVLRKGWRTAKGEPKRFTPKATEVQPPPGGRGHGVGRRRCRGRECPPCRGALQ